MTSARGCRSWTTPLTGTGPRRPSPRSAASPSSRAWSPSTRPPPARSTPPSTTPPPPAPWPAACSATMCSTPTSPPRPGRRPAPRGRLAGQLARLDRGRRPGVARLGHRPQPGHPAGVRPPAHRAGLGRAGRQLEAALAAGLGGVHGHVGLMEDGVDLGGAADGDADAGPDLDLAALEREGGPHRLEGAPGDPDRA